MTEGTFVRKESLAWLQKVPHVNIVPSLADPSSEYFVLNSSITLQTHLMRRHWSKFMQKMHFCNSIIMKRKVSMPLGKCVTRCPSWVCGEALTETKFFEEQFQNLQSMKHEIIHFGKHHPWILYQGISLILGWFMQKPWEIPFIKPRISPM